ncbi:PQQ-binding-like beta-propeller repeat protein [Halospeciosus flavus]|uniref:PQQ-binding-like beta-propeller repeat protein n=1 Tax=Halospeciosus flavus TaxID=3032283 RepID=A0ABD5Z5M1_9EURY|nr:PQQ-binding-like beta-propeller repeat protein [Halospeciosus flavus]
MVSRRSFLQAAGLAAVGSATALAGCSSSCPDSGAPTPSTVLTPDSTPVAADLGVTTDWPTFHHDAANTGYATDATPPSDPALSWRAAVPSDGRPSAPVVANGAVYVRDGVGGLHALDVTDGTERWTVETTRAPETWFAGGGSPTAHGGHVFVAGRDGVFAVDAADGTVAWSDSLAATDSAVVAGGSVFVPTDGALAAYDAATGERRWRVSDFDGPVSRPAVAAGTVFAVGSDLVALASADGVEQWRRTVGASPTDLGFPVVADGSVFVGTYEGLVAYAPESGEVQWRFERGSGRGFTPPVVTPESLYTVEQPGEGPAAVYALDPDTGEPRPRWCSWIGEGAVGAATDDRVFAEVPAPDEADVSGREVQTFRSDTGAATWQFRASEWVGAPAVVDGAVVFTTGRGDVCAVGGDQQ